MMKRNLTDKLLAWKNSRARKPLIIKGVRQCGKTCLLKEFGKSRYEDCAYLAQILDFIPRHNTY
jgi:predicted AAA+ superfamily ATPase